MPQCSATITLDGQLSLFCVHESKHGGLHRFEVASEDIGWRDEADGER